METVTWILSAVLGGMMVIAGATKLITPHAKLVEDPKMAWAGDFDARQVKAIAAAELLGAVGLIIPWWTGVAPVLTPISGVCLVVIMAGAALVHARRKEPSGIVLPAALGVLAVVVTVLRFAQL